MRLPPEAIATIELGARLHDIGKVGVHRDVLQKCGPLSVAEWTAMRLHTEIGAAALRDTPKLAFLAPIVRAHHERMDGQGYPDGLRGEEIPLESRVLAVADAFHAMTSARWYRRAMMPNDALAILAENAGPHFDPDVVEATLTLLHFGRRKRTAIA
jgi:HD-GYP domain-containing protein (c-di-GMP phosphodiesterase class II)